MKKCVYLDCISGISGDMLLAALIDLGADPVFIKKELLRLPIDDFDLWVETVDKRGITAKKLCLRLPEGGDEHHHHDGDAHGHAHDHPHVQGQAAREHHHHEHRKAAVILEMIRESELSERVKARSLAIFEQIAAAEGKIHGIDPAEVHFHEVGAMDSIIDTVGICLALEALGIDALLASPVPTGYGKVRMAHGLYPVPAPATAELLQGIPLAKSHTEGELTTPTGAGVLKALVSRFGPLEQFTVEKIGYGAGTKDFAVPNVIRVLMGQSHAPEDAQVCSTAGREMIAVLEVQVDDCTGEACGYVMERLFEAGALDVYFTAVQMKKNRPGALVTVLCVPEKADRLEELMLRESTTFGVRRSAWTRRILEREFAVRDTPYGAVRVKIGRLNGEVVQASPEYEDVARVAREQQVPFLEVYRAAAHENNKARSVDDSR